MRLFKYSILSDDNFIFVFVKELFAKLKEELKRNFLFLIPVNIKEQKLKSVERKGYTVIEWGGSNI